MDAAAADHVHVAACLPGTRASLVGVAQQRVVQVAPPRRASAAPHHPPRCTVLPGITRQRDRQRTKTGFRSPADASRIPACANPPGTIFRSGSTAHSILCELRALTIAFLLPVIQMTVPGYVATGDVRTASLTVVDQDHTHRSRAYRCVCAGRAVLMIFSYVMWKHNLAVRIGGGHVHHRLHRARCHRYV